MRIKRKHISSRSTNVPKYIISGGGIREMDRLTEMNENKTAHFYPQCFEKCGGVGYSRKCDSCDLIGKVCDKLGEYEDLEEQGKLLKLEGKYQKIMIRQEFWIVVNGSDVRHGRISRVNEWWNDVNGFYGEYTLIPEKGRGGWILRFDDFGKTVFPTREEAEAALEAISF